MKCAATLLFSLFMADAMAQNISINLENVAVQRYMSEVTYTPDDSSLISNYEVSSPNRGDVPVAAVVPLHVTTNTTKLLTYSLKNDFTDGVTISVASDVTEVKIFNLVPQRKYYYKVEADGKMLSYGVINTSGQVRMIYAPSVYNVRDLGGWPTTDNKRIRYGKIYRGSELNGLHVADSADIEVLRSLGIGAEIDMRAFFEEEHGISAFGFESSGLSPSFFYTSDSGQLPEHLTSDYFLYRWHQAFLFTVNNLRAGRAVYVHCRYGADRTGYFALLLEGLLGVDYDGLVKDYELTSFFIKGKTKVTIDPVLSFIENLDGTTLQQKFNTFFTKNMYVSQNDVDYFRSVMLTDSTGIKTSFQSPMSNLRPSTTYDLMGRRLLHPKKGLFIQIGADGKRRLTTLPIAKEP